MTCEREIEALLKDLPRPGRPREVSLEKEAEIVRLTQQGPPAGAGTHWSRRTLAPVAGVSASTIGRVWKAHGLQPHRVETFKISQDPQFVEKLHDVVGLYLCPPERAIIFSVDAKTQIQALVTLRVLIMGRVLRPAPPPEQRVHSHTRNHHAARPPRSPQRGRISPGRGRGRCPRHRNGPGDRSYLRRTVLDDQRDHGAGLHGRLACDVLCITKPDADNRRDMARHELQSGLVQEAMRVESAAGRRSALNLLLALGLVDLPDEARLQGVLATPPTDTLPLWPQSRSPGAAKAAAAPAVTTTTAATGDTARGRSQ